MLEAERTWATSRLLTVVMPAVCAVGEEILSLSSLPEDSNNFDCSSTERDPAVTYSIVKVEHLDRKYID